MQQIKSKKIHLLGVGITLLTLLVSLIWALAPTRRADANIITQLNLPEKALNLVTPPEKSLIPDVKPESTPVITADSDKSVMPAPQFEKVVLQIRKGDSLAALFKKHQFSAAELHHIMQSGEAASRLRRIQPGDELAVHFNKERSIQKLNYTISPVEHISITRIGDNFQSRHVTQEVEKRIAYATATINDSLFLDGRKAGLSVQLIMELADIFGWDIDFALDMRSGDQFTLIYQEHYLNGEKIEDGAILAAEFINQNKSYRALRYTSAEGKTDYYSEDGKNLRKAFLRTPVDFARISSHFNLKRKHPILNRIRAHTGVDYAASRGTPIRATGNGKIIHRGRKGGYGRTIEIQHGTSYSTLYAHLNSYKSGLSVGSKVSQGQIIGYVGSSGLATGPHLHYEFRVNGVHHNPLTVKLPAAEHLPKTEYATFTTKTAEYVSQLDSIRRTRLALLQK